MFLVDYYPHSSVMPVPKKVFAFEKLTDLPSKKFLRGKHFWSL